MFENGNVYSKIHGRSIYKSDVLPPVYWSDIPSVISLWMSNRSSLRNKSSSILEKKKKPGFSLLGPTKYRHMITSLYTQVPVSSKPMKGALF